MREKFLQVVGAVDGEHLVTSFHVVERQAPQDALLQLRD